MRFDPTVAAATSIFDHVRQVESASPDIPRNLHLLDGKSMSDQQGDEQGGTTRTFANPRDAKAQAKADKAYKKATRPWFKKKRFILLGLIVLIFVIVAATGGGGDDSTATKDAGTVEEAAPAAEEAAPAAAPAFPGAADSDVVGAPGDTLDLGNAQVTATQVFAGDATFGATVCSTVTLVNSSDKAIDFNAFDWKLQSPAGTIVDVGFMGSESLLLSGGIAPGGTATGDACFDGEATAGQYVLFYEPIFAFFSDRAAWVNTI